MTVGYAYRQPEKLDQHSITYWAPDDDLEDTLEPPDATTANRRLSVHVKMTGLLLAHKLGILSQESMHDMSQALANCVGAIWVTCDEEKHVRHAVYADAKSHMAIELSCDSDNDNNNNTKQWTHFFRHVQKCAASLKEDKATILNPLLQQLASASTTTIKSPWSVCESQLKAAVSKHKVFVFCSDDTVLHQLKVPIAGVFKTPRSRGVYIQTLANHTITALTTPSVVFINLAEYFNFHGKTFHPYNDDGVLWQVAQDWLPTDDGNDSFTSWAHPELKHSIKKLKNHAQIFDETTHVYTRNRSMRNASVILKLWSALVAYCNKEFNFDLASQPHTSLSKMSFDIVWLGYSDQAGPFAHALENLHPYSVYKLRPFCKGGFSYSFENYLSSQQQPMAEGKEPAKSIRELDVCSAYGASGMQMSAAKGFGLTFGDDQKTQKRYKSFEYRATMYTIFKLVICEEMAIRAVYSNYSPLGLVYIGKHALDLVVVLEDEANTVKLYQFDGHFCHGDYNHKSCCPLFNAMPTTRREQSANKQPCNVTKSFSTGCCNNNNNIKI